MEIRPDEFLSFYEWLGSAILFFLIAVPALTFLAVFLCYLYSAVRYGPVEGFYAVARTIATAIGDDLVHTSPRRVLAIARLAIQEAIRRRVLFAFAVFAVIFLFAGWFLDTSSNDPARLYLSFVLTTTNYLVILLALFLSTFSLPADIKSKTIFTVVTKPVRAGEIVLGRVLGFTAVISVLLIAMCVVSYFFVVRGLDHEHGVNAESVTATAADATAGTGAGWEGETTSNSHHKHVFTVDESGNGRTDEMMGHWHPVTTRGEPGDPAALVIGEPQDALRARVPIYGQLEFRDRDGNRTRKGISVGKEWEYRSYIEGRTLAKATWTFDGLSEQEFSKGLPLSLTLSVFRTNMGDIVTGVRGIIIVSRPDPRSPLQCAPIPFESQEFVQQQVFIDRNLRAVAPDGTLGQEIDLFEDLVNDGKVNISIQCDDRGQYFGMAQADVYIESSDAPFGWNFVKAFIGIWLQVLIVVCLGVMFSTFLSSAVAMMATLSAILLGFFSNFVSGIWTGETYGGGPVESLIRLVTQENVMQQLELPRIPLLAIKGIDFVLITIMNAVAVVLPDFTSLGRTSAYLANSLNIYGDLLARHFVTTLLYVLAITIVGYFFLKTREIAA
jgi:hypothetical protein